MEVFEIKDDCLVKINDNYSLAHVVSRRIKKIGAYAFSNCSLLEKLLKYYIQQK